MFYRPLRSLASVVTSPRSSAPHDVKPPITARLYLTAHDIIIISHQPQALPLKRDTAILVSLADKLLVSITIFNSLFIFEILFIYYCL